MADLPVADVTRIQDSQGENIDAVLDGDTVGTGAQRGFLTFGKFGSTIKLLQLDTNGNVILAPPTAGANGGKKVAVTHTAVALGSGSLISGVVICANSTNVSSIFVGTATVTDDYNTPTSGYELQPGGAVGWAINNLSQVFINGTANDGVSFLGS